MAVDFKIFPATRELREAAEEAAEQLDGRQPVQIFHNGLKLSLGLELYQSTLHEGLVTQLLKEHIRRLYCSAPTHTNG